MTFYVLWMRYKKAGQQPGLDHQPFQPFQPLCFVLLISSLSRFAESLWGEIMVAKAHGLKIALLKYENFPVSYNVLNLKK